MAFLDIFLSEEKKIQKNRQRLTSKDAQAEDREAAARWLADNKSDKALLALLSRFDIRLDHQMNDKAEKEFLYTLAAGVGEPMLKPLRSWLKQCKLVSIPLKLYEELAGHERTVQAVFKLLRALMVRDDFKPQKKHTLLVWLAEHQVDGALEAATAFIGDFDEDVRCAAVEVLIKQGVDVAEILERVMTKNTEDSNRLRHRIAEVFTSRGWKVGDPDAFQAVLPDGYAVRDSRVVNR